MGLSESRPTVYCFAAFTREDGSVDGAVHRVSLETADWMRQTGYTIIGPDPHDMFALAEWERQQVVKWPWQA